jgi:hypothetical protein
MSGRCYRCGADIDARQGVGRRAACLRCGSDLHCCRNCRFHDAAYHNECRETHAERQVDKERANFCEYFALADTAGRGAAAAADPARARLDALFRKRRA